MKSKIRSEKNSKSKSKLKLELETYGNAEIVSEVSEERRRSVGGRREVERVFRWERGRCSGGSGGGSDGGGGRREDFVVGEIEKVVDTKQVR